MEEPQAPPQVSVLLVSYNAAAALRRCLAALERSAEREKLEIVVVDNGSQDASDEVPAEFPNVTALRLPRNFGYVKALNIGMRTAKGEFFLFLSPRTEVAPDTVSALAAVLEKEQSAVAVCPALVTPEGVPVPHIFKLPRPETVSAIAAAGRFETAVIPEEAVEPVPVALASFAALMARSYFLKGLRYIDEHYAQSWADAEVAAQILRAGRKTLLVPAARATLHPEDNPRSAMPATPRALLEADWAMGAATFAAKHVGWAAGLRIRLTTAVKSLFSFQLHRLTYLIGSQKIDGTQSGM
jgi:GT2 family glycosyltransferase